jgi:hypothetical protein
MDTSELLEQLQRRVAETARDRDRLASAVKALEGDIGRYEDERELVERLVEKFARESSPTSITQDSSADAIEQDKIKLSWPVGPGHTKKIKVKKAKAWANYKFVAADWYLNTLRDISLQEGGLRRVLGVEMAVDGVVQSLSAAFDASIFALTGAIERAIDIPKDRRTPPHLANWSKLGSVAKYFEIDLASSLSISIALVGEHSDTPEGWLAQLLALRSRSIGQNPLTERTREPGLSCELCIEVPGGGIQPLLAYLTETRDLINELLETIFYDLGDVKKGRLYTSGQDQRRAQAEQGFEDLFPLA